MLTPHTRKIGLILGPIRPSQQSQGAANLKMILYYDGFTDIITDIILMLTNIKVFPISNHKSNKFVFLNASLLFLYLCLFDPAHTHTHTASVSRSILLIHIHTHTHTLPVSLDLSYSFTYTHTHTHTHTLLVSLDLSYSHTYTHTLSLCLQIFPTHTNTHTHTQTHTHTLSHTLSLPLTPCDV